MPGTRHRRRVYSPGRQLCGPWQPQPPKPPSKRLIGTDGIVGTVTIIGTVAIIGAVTIIGIDTIIGTVAIIGAAAIIGIDTIIGIRITAPITGAITGIPIIGDTPGRRSNQRNTAIETPLRVAGFSINNSNADIASELNDGLTGTTTEGMFGKLVSELL